MINITRRQKKDHSGEAFIGPNIIILEGSTQEMPPGLTGQD
jgi:hypothetical protein